MRTGTVGSSDGGRPIGLPPSAWLSWLMRRRLGRHAFRVRLVEGLQHPAHPELVDLPAAGHGFAWLASSSVDPALQTGQLLAHAEQLDRQAAVPPLQTQDDAGQHRDVALDVGAELAHLGRQLVQLLVQPAHPGQGVALGLGRHATILAICGDNHGLPLREW